MALYPRYTWQGDSPMRERPVPRSSCGPAARKDQHERSRWLTGKGRRAGTQEHKISSRLMHLIVYLTTLSKVHNPVSPQILRRRGLARGQILAATALVQNPLRPKHLVAESAAGKTRTCLSAPTSRVFAKAKQIRLNPARLLSRNNPATMLGRGGEV